MRALIQKIIPPNFYKKIMRPYHWSMALLGALIYRFPSRKIKIIGVTGTKGKSSTVELINAVLEDAGHKTALSSTIRFKIGSEDLPNKYKMTMPGRFFLQHFLREAVTTGCSYAIIEMTSEGVTQFRHKWIDLDVLVFTNIAPEHIESHGSFKNYLAAKLELRDSLEASGKKDKWMIANRDDAHAREFLKVTSAQPITFSLKDATPSTANTRGVLLTIEGESIHCPLLGAFNIYNILAALAVGTTQDIPLSVMKRAIEKFSHIPGRAEEIICGQPFTIIVDYAHTPDSLEQLYSSFKNSHKGRRICVLGNTGGGRDRWKRPVMGGIADTYCTSIILTDEDPYDEDLRIIVEEVASGIKKHKPDIIMDRRHAIREALSRARRGDVVLITGKGTDPYIMGPRGARIPWSDKQVAEEEMKALLKEQESAKENRAAAKKKGVDI